MRFLKSLPEKLNHIKHTALQASGCASLRLYVMDESRFGMLSVQRRCLTARGTKPLTPYQHHFGNFYLFGAYSPGSGDHFTLELPYCNSDCFQAWMDEFSLHLPEEFKVVIVDNGAFHKAARLRIPPNIYLLFLPPYSPELNPAELIWRWVKDRIANTVYQTLDRLAEDVAAIIKALNNNTVKSITGWKIYQNI